MAEVMYVAVIEQTSDMWRDGYPMHEDNVFCVGR